MLEKIWNSFFYGNTKTKLFLWSVLILALGALFLLLAGIVLATPSLIMGGVGVGMVGFIVSQSVSLKDLQREKKKKIKKDNKANKGTTDSEHSKKEVQENAFEKEERTRKEKEHAKARFLASMNSKKLKKEMKEHKVNQIHVKVMIDSYPAKKIEQAPAVLWRTDTMLHFMVLTDTVDEFEVPLSDITGFLLVKNVPVDKEKDYISFRLDNYISKMFRSYLPEHFDITKDGRLQTVKNTFRIEPGIYLTNSSVANLRRVLLPGVAFLVDDQVIASRKFNEYFKELYRSSLLCKNLIISLDEYKEQITETLNALLVAPIEDAEFANTLYDLNKYHLITSEHLAIYTQRYREIKITKNE